MTTAFTHPHALPSTPPGEGRTIPFDYVFRFTLEGSPGHNHQRTISVSVEAAFVAVSVGYGAIPALTPPPFEPVVAPGLALITQRSLRDIRLGEIMDGADRIAPRFLGGSGDGGGAEAVLREGVRVNPAFTRAFTDTNWNDPIGDAGLARQLFELVHVAPGELPFLYAMFDQGSGREFQSEPILSTAALGSADGDRPFRVFPVPIRFEPRSAIRIQITEQARWSGELHIALHGYKVLGAPGSPTSEARRRRVRTQGSRL